MAITGTGTEQDPYIVTTYAELIEKAAESGKYVKIGNDIDVLTEYPNGDVPMLAINSEVDGDGRTINGLYKNSGNESYCISVSSGGSLLNTVFTAIDTTKSLIYTTARPITNCKFAGKSSGYIVYGDEFREVSKCSFNMDCGSSYPFRISDSGLLSDCNIKVKSSAVDIFETSDRADLTLTNCYIEGDMPNYSGIHGSNDGGGYSNYDNCVFDITTSQTFTLNPRWRTASTSIINITHAPNCTASGQVTGVSDEHWLDVAYLQSVGFNIVEVQE